MKKSILYKEKTNKMYWVMLCVLLVSGAIVCSTNDNGDGNGGGGGGENSESPFVCTNGQEVTDSNTTEGENIQNCTSCDAGFTPIPVSGSDRTTCEPDSGFAFVCPNGRIANGTSDTADVENCASCNTNFTQTPASESNRMTCEPNQGTNAFVCPNGQIANGTSDTADVENCASCNEGFGKVTQGERTICQPEFVCSNGTAASGTTTMANVENCASCNPGFGPEDVDSGARSTCNALPIALWNAGSHAGDFGFGLCQNRINAGSTDAIGSDLNNRGYTKAVFFGSTNTYDFPDIGTDTDALGDNGDVSGRQLVVFTASGVSVSVTNTFGSTPVTRTLGQVTNVTNFGGWQNGGDDVVGVAGITTTTTQAWSFTANREFGVANSCNSATSNVGIGIRMGSTSVDGSTLRGGPIVSSCNDLGFVLCVAR